MAIDSQARRDRVAGCLIGSAIGDSWGWQTEFSSIAIITREWPPSGPDQPTRDKQRPTVYQVTDDTQMALAVGEALVAAHAHSSLSVQSVESSLRHAFLDWFNSPDNTRAPGNTCMKACRNFYFGKNWLDSTVVDSKGCGANMRVPPVGLLPDAWVGDDDETRRTTRAAIAQLQSAMTHGHATALAASDLTAEAVYRLLNGTEPQTLVAELRDYAESQRNVYHAEWLDLSPRDELWDRAQAGSPSDFISGGWDECLARLDDVEYGVRYKSPEVDACEITGQGWIAEEAFASALLCFLWHPDEPLKAVKRAVVSAGDSDSIACLAGAFCGARHGLGVWPKDWVEQIEYRDRLDALTKAFSE